MSDIKQAEIDYLKRVCFDDVQDSNGHLFYRGLEKGKYARTSPTLRSTKYHMRKAQLSLFLKLKEVGFDMKEWGEELTTSHLCHKKDCLRQDHLCLETLEQNRERDERNRRRQCSGHKDQPDCLV